MKQFLFLLLVLTGFYANAQAVFRHVTAASNTTAHITTLDHPQLNGNPNAMVFVTTNWGTGGVGADYGNNVGVLYNGTRWTIFNQNINLAMPAGITFNVMTVPQGTPGVFRHTVTAATKEANGFINGSQISHPSLDGKDGVIVMVTQCWTGTYNDNPIQIGNRGGCGLGGTVKWTIANGSAKADGSDYSNFPMPVGASFNIMVIENGKVPGFSAAKAYTHIAKPETIIPAGQHITFFDHPELNGKPDAMVFVTPFWGRGTICTDGPYILGPTSVWYDHPQDAWKHKEGYWSVYYGRGGTPMPNGAKFNVVVVPNNSSTVSGGLRGWVDMHTHPMSHLGFGKKLMHGAPDIGSIIPAGTRNCNSSDFRATNIQEALGNCNSTHGGWGTDNGCGNYIRAVAISKGLDTDFAFNVNHDPLGGGNLHGDHRHEGIETSPSFAYWPHQTSVAHQQMWWEWIKRAYQEGGLRVMVALTVNSELLAEVIDGDNPKDDKASSDLQIDEIKSFVGRHSDFMEVAYSARDLRRIVSANKLAVIIGVEVDNIGNFHKSNVVCNETTVKAEIQRLYDKGVRYTFPIHLVDNKFGGAAVYEDLFNFANKYSTGSLYRIQPAATVDPNIGHRLGAGLDGAGNLGIKAALDGASGIPFPPAFDLFKCPVPTLGCWDKFKGIAGLLAPDPLYATYARTAGGHVNEKGLSSLGIVAMQEMMRLGMIIDIDHMSQKSINDALALAERPENRYPLNMGHNGIRERGGKEREAQRESVGRLAALGGVFGVGTADTEAPIFIEAYNKAWSAMGGKSVAMGTDVNGMEPLPKKSAGLNTADFYNGFSKCQTGNRTWDYTQEGVAHYGLMADFMRDIRMRNNQVYENLMGSAEYFARMWEKCDERSRVIASGGAGNRIIQPEPINGLCPFNRVAGDGDFGGHGPHVTGDVTLRITSDGRRVEAVINFNARETQSDWSEVRGSWTRTVYTAPATMRISAITSPTRSTINQVLAGGGRFEPTEGCDGGEHRITPGGPVARMVVVGDTGGGDISTDNNCNCDTRINLIEFNPITVTLAQR